MGELEKASAITSIEEHARHFTAVAEVMRRRAEQVRRGELVLYPDRASPSERAAWERSFRREATYFLGCAERIRSIDVGQFARNQRHLMRYTGEE